MQQRSIEPAHPGNTLVQQHDGGVQRRGGQAEQLAAPVISTGSRGVYVSHGANRHQIQWSAVANASGYELAYSADGVRWTTVSASGTGAVDASESWGMELDSDITDYLLEICGKTKEKLLLNLFSVIEQLILE